MTFAPRHRRAFTLLEIIVLLFLLAIVCAILTPHVCGMGATRAAVSRVQSDMRSLATALATYYVDNNSYPFAIAPSFDRRHVGVSLRQPLRRIARHAGAPEEFGPLAEGHSLDANARRLAAERVTFAHPGVAWNKPGGFATVTTPMAYIAAYPRDPFSPGESLTYSYLPDNPGFVLASFPPRDPEHDGHRSPDPTVLSSLSATMRAQLVDRSSTPFDGRNFALSRQLLRVGVAADGRALTYDPTNGTRSEGSVWRISD